MKEHLEERQTTTSDPEKLPEVLMVGTEQGKEEEEFGTGLNSKRKEELVGMMESKKINKHINKILQCCVKQ